MTISNSQIEELVADMLGVSCGQNVRAFQLMTDACAALMALKRERETIVRTVHTDAPEAVRNSVKRILETSEAKMGERRSQNVQGQVEAVARELDGVTKLPWCNWRAEVAERVNKLFELLGVGAEAQPAEVAPSEEEKADKYQSFGIVARPTDEARVYPRLYDGEIIRLFSEYEAHKLHDRDKSAMRAALQEFLIGRLPQAVDVPWQPMGTIPTDGTVVEVQTTDNHPAPAWRPVADSHYWQIIKRDAANKMTTVMIHQENIIRWRPYIHERLMSLIEVDPSIVDGKQVLADPVLPRGFQLVSDLEMAYMSKCREIHHAFESGQMWLWDGDIDAKAPERATMVTMTPSRFAYLQSCLKRSR